MVPIKTLKYQYGAHWSLIFYHDVSTEVVFDDETIIFSNDNYRYSILGAITDSYKIGNYYEYLLEYPGFEGYNRWMQKIDINSTQINNTSLDIGYKEVHIDFSSNWGGGLSRSYYQQYTFYDGSPGPVYNGYWFSIGCKVSKYLGKIQYPGLHYATGSDGVQKTILWIRIPSSFCSFNIRRANIISYIFI